jgi:tRNA dimethylallyltransferase
MPYGPRSPDMRTTSLWGICDRPARVAAIVGPTAAGKTACALRIATTLGAEIVSMDSMQIYRAMDVGTSKPPSDMIDRVPHHMIDLKDPDEDVTVAEFQALARSAIADIASRSRLPLLVGGSGLYFRAVVDDLRFPPRSPALRRELEEEAERIGVHALHRRLASLDPRAAARIEPGNVRRTIRALEVIETTGRPFSENDGWGRYESIYELAVAGVTAPRPYLYESIARRTDSMIQNGLIDEARRLYERGLSTTARQALGYRQILESAPDAPAGDITREIVRATKRYARRQESWFAADPRVVWFDASHRDVDTRVTEFFRTSLGFGGDAGEAYAQRNKAPTTRSHG